MMVSHAHALVNLHFVVNVSNFIMCVQTEESYD